LNTFRKEIFTYCVSDGLTGDMLKFCNCKFPRFLVGFTTRF